jgi:hypothetical protein
MLPQSDLRAPGGAGRAARCDRIKIVPVDSVSRWLERDRLGSRIQVIR